MKKLSKYSNVLFMLIVFVLQRNANNVESATLDQNSYTLNIAISDQVSSIPDKDQLPFLQILQASHYFKKLGYFFKVDTNKYMFLQDTMNNASKLLFQATYNHFYFKTISVLLPRLWNVNITTSVSPA